MDESIKDAKFLWKAVRHTKSPETLDAIHQQFPRYFDSGIVQNTHVSPHTLHRIWKLSPTSISNCLQIMRNRNVSSETLDGIAKSEMSNHNNITENVLTHPNASKETKEHLRNAWGNVYKNW